MLHVLNDTAGDTNIQVNNVKQIMGKSSSWDVGSTTESCMGNKGNEQSPIEQVEDSLCCSVGKGDESKTLLGLQETNEINNGPIEQVEVTSFRSGEEGNAFS